MKNRQRSTLAVEEEETCERKAFFRWEQGWTIRETRADILGEGRELRPGDLDDLGLGPLLHTRVVALEGSEAESDVHSLLPVPPIQGRAVDRHDARGAR